MENLFIKEYMTAVENIRLEYICVLIEFKHSLFSHAGCLLNTTLPCVGFPVAGLDRAKIRFSPISKVFVYCCHSDIDFTCTI